MGFKDTEPMLFTMFLNVVIAAIMRFDGIVTGGGMAGAAWFCQPRSATMKRLVCLPMNW